MPVMPNIPTSQSVFSSGALQSQQVNATAADFGALPAQALGQMGQSLQQVGSDLGGIAHQQRMIQVETDANNVLTTQLTPQLRQIYSEFHSLQGINAVSKQAEYQQKIEDAVASARDSLKDPLAKKALDETGRRYAISFQNGMADYAGNQNKVYHQQTSDGLVSSFRQDVLTNPNDSKFVDGRIESAAQEIMTQGQYMGEPIEYINQKIAQNTAQVQAARLLAIAQQDPIRAQDILHNGETYTDNNGNVKNINVSAQLAALPGDSYASLQRQINETARHIQIGNLATNAVMNNTVPDTKGFFEVIKSLEGGGTVENEKVSPKGAIGPMQVMPATAKDPGYGIKPWNGTPEDRVRLGQDYAATALAHNNGNSALALAAYNAGIGQVDKWKQQFGDPSKGEISTDAFIAKIPFKETRDYAAKGYKMMQQGEQPKVAVSPDPADLMARSPQILDSVRNAAQAMYPNNPVAVEEAVTRTRDQIHQVVQGQKMQETGAQQVIFNNIAAGKINSMSAMLADPQSAQAYSMLSPVAKQDIIKAFSPDVKHFTDQSLNMYAQLKGMALNDPQKFLSYNMAQLSGSMPTYAVKDLIDLQSRIANNKAGGRSSFDFARTKGIVTPLLKPMKFDDETTNQFYGKLESSVESYHDQTGKYPDDLQMRKIAGALIQQVTVPTAPGLFGSGTMQKPAFQVKDWGHASIPVPPKYAQGIAGVLAQKFGRQPTDQEISQYYTRYATSIKGALSE